MPPFHVLPDVITPLVDRGASVREGMDRVLEFCARARPKGDWTPFRSVDVEAGALELEAWIARVLATTPPPTGASGLYFGLFNPVDHDKPSADLYVCGAPFVANDNDWMCTPTWTPHAAYAHSATLRELYRLAYADAQALRNDAEYPLCLGFAIFSVATALRALGPSRVLAGASARLIAVGFDSGEWFNVGVLSPVGLVPPSRPSRPSAPPLGPP